MRSQIISHLIYNHYLRLHNLLNQHVWLVILCVYNGGTDNPTKDLILLKYFISLGRP